MSTNDSAATTNDPALPPTTSDVKANTKNLPIDAEMPGSTAKSLSLSNISLSPKFYASKTDETLERLSKLIKTTAGLGALLSTLNYGLHILSYIDVNSPSRAQILALISRFLGRTPQLPASVTSKLPTIQPAPPGVSRLAPFSAIVSDTRVSLRLTGLIPLYVLLKTLINRKSPSDSLLHNIAITQVLCYMGFQSLENFWHLGNKGVIAPHRVARVGGSGKLLQYSCRFWLAGITCDLIRLAREAQVAKTKPVTSEKEQSDLDSKWWSELWIALSWYPMAVHYSVDGGIGLNQGMVGLSGFSAGIGNFVKAWNATAA